MTKAELILYISKNTDMDKKTVETIVENFFSTVINTMANGHNIYVRGFGSFINKKKAKKIRRNIRMKTPVIIEEHFAPKFKPSKKFIAEIKTSIGSNVSISRETVRSRK
jgi:DNA-binding protein HU-beta